MAGHETTPLFLDAPHGRIFVVRRRPAEVRASGSAALIVPPFAEEMNKSRRWMHDLTCAMAERGIVSAIVDPYGTGDSGGDLADATPRLWFQDLCLTRDWLMSQSLSVDYLVGVRFGCLLAAAWLTDSAVSVKHTTFVAPVLKGSMVIRQLLRMRIAANLTGGDGLTVKQLQQQLDDGQSVMAAGYELTPSLVAEISRWELDQLASERLGRVTWCEVADGEPGPAVAQAVNRMLDQGVEADVLTRPGEPFWSTTEIVRNPALVAGAVNEMHAADG